MTKKMPTYSICNLLGADRCMAEIVVTRLRDFVNAHQDIQFPNQVYYRAPGQIHTWEFDSETEGYLVNFNESFFASMYHNPH